MLDDYRHKGQRRRMLMELKEVGIQDDAVLAAMDNVPRHFFFVICF